MISKTKHQLSGDAVKTLVRHCFPDKQATMVTEHKGGMFNSAYEISLADTGQDPIILKVGTHPTTPVLTYEKDIMRTEAAVYRLIAENTEVPTPALLYSDFSREQLASDYLFLSRLRGTAWNNSASKLRPRDKAVLLEELGGYVARLHSIQGSYFGYFSENPQAQFTSWRTAFTQMVRQILNDGKQRCLPLPYEKIEAILERHGALLDEIRTPSLVDYDLWAGNIFIEQVEGKWSISGLIDFERAFWGDPCADFVASVGLYQDVEKETAFQKGYATQTGTPFRISDNDRTRMRMYRMYLHLIMAVETYRYGGLKEKGMLAICRCWIRKDIKNL